jgi:hypothetical protein
MYKQAPNTSFYYDSTYNYLYLQVHNLPKETTNRTAFSRKKSSIAAPPINWTNVAIYDIVADDTRYLLETDPTRKIKLFLFEQEYHAEQQKMVFNNNIGNIINNKELPATAPKDKLLVVLENTEQKSFEFWSSDKQGKNLQLLKRIAWDLTWKLDIKNNKILFIQPLSNAVNIEAIDW